MRRLAVCMCNVYEFIIIFLKHAIQMIHGEWGANDVYIQNIQE